MIMVKRISVCLLGLDNPQFDPTPQEMKALHYDDRKNVKQWQDWDNAMRLIRK